jgi:hypothetical protein
MHHNILFEVFHNSRVRRITQINRDLLYFDHFGLIK